ncbi:MAG TPA: phosphopantetheine-binding protein, partial [Steroidobacteraceae bacterium]
GDHIYGVLKATSLNHGGRTNGYTVPNPAVQGDLVARCLREAKVDPGAVSYIEAHGTGTSLGDPIEIEGLSKAFNQLSRKPLIQTCAIGSIKSNLGHCESAAGIAGVTKVLLQIKHRQLVPSLHCARLNRNIAFEKTPFRVQRELEPWNRPVLSIGGNAQEYPRIAGVSSFGAGGSNAHAVIEEYIPPQTAAEAPTPASRTPFVILLSAASEAQLIQQAMRLRNYIQTHRLTDEDLACIAYTVQIGREALRERLATTVSDMAGLLERLETLATSEGKLRFIGWLRGTAGGHTEAELLGADEDLQGAVEKWIERGKYSQLLSFWSNGGEVDWEKLYPRGQTPKRVSLPTYPFAKERCWVDIAVGAGGAAPQVAHQEAAVAQRDVCDRSGPASSSTPVAAYGQGWTVVEPVPVRAMQASAKATLVIDGSGDVSVTGGLLAAFPRARHQSLLEKRPLADVIAEMELAAKVEHVVWCLPLNRCTRLDSDELVAVQEVGVLFGLRLVSALVSRGYDSRPLQLSVITWQTQRLDAETFYPAHAAVYGLLGSVAREHAHWSVRAVDLPLEHAPGLVKTALAVIGDQGGSAWLHRAGKWYRQQLLPMAVELQTSQKTREPCIGSMERAQGMAALESAPTATASQVMAVKTSDSDVMAGLFGMPPLEREGAPPLRQQVALAPADGISTESPPRQRISLSALVPTQTEADSSPLRHSAPREPGSARRAEVFMSAGGASSPVTRAADPVRDAGTVREIVRECLASSLELTPERLRDDQAFAELGVDSVIAVSLVNQINGRIGLKLKTTVIYDYSTVEK